MVFALYYNEEEICLKIYPFKTLQKLEKEEVKYWNDNIFISNSKKLLNKKANELKEIWLKNHNESIEKIKNMEIIRRYK